MGIFLGRFLKVCSFDIFFCCRSLILVRLVFRVFRFFLKNVGEYLEKGYNYIKVF